MRSPAIVVSILVHAGIAYALLRAPIDRRSHVVSIEVERTSTPRPREEPKRSPPPTPRIATLARGTLPSRPAPLPIPVEKAQPSARSPAPFDTGLQLGNGGDGIALPPPPRAEHAPPPPASAPPPPRRESAAPRASAEAPCEEPPSKPSVIDRPAAIEYTADARAGGVEGRLVLKVIVAADGSVREVEVVDGVQAALDAAAIAAVKTWRFQPSSRCGKPIDGGVYMLARRFELGD